MRRSLVPTLVLALALQGCPGASAPTGAAAPRKSARPVVQASEQPGVPAPRTSLAPGTPAIAPLLASGPPRLVAQTGELGLLTGKVKVLSDHGASIISNNSGTLISDKGSSLVANNSAGLVANNSAGLVANNSAGLAPRAAAGVAPRATRHLLQDAQAESPLADAAITVFDGTGRQLVDEAGKPLVAISDGTGAYKLSAALPAENLVLRVKLWNGGELSAILPRGAAGERVAAIDTAATLGAAYVMTQFVKGDPATFEKLPAAEAERLYRDLDAARGLLGKRPTYTSDDLVALTDELRTKAPTVDQTLTDIKALLLGQANLGGGRQATEVPIGDPRALLRLADGSLLVSECVMGRIRRIAPDGTISTWLDSMQGEKVKANWFSLADLALAPDGAIYAIDGGTHRVRKIAPDGSTSIVVGNGQEDGPIGATGLDAAIDPWGVSLGADGTLYVAEAYRGSQEAPRALAVAPGGAARVLGTSPEAWRGFGIINVRPASDGSVWALLRRRAAPDSLWRLASGAATWTFMAGDLALDKEGYMTLGPDGLPVVSESEGGRVVRVALDGTKTVLAGKGGPVGTAALAAPSGLLFEPDGTLLIGDGGANAVWRLEKNATLTRLAGALKITQNGADGALAINTPGGIGFDPRGRMLVVEGGSHTVKRLDGTTLETIAGNALGFAGDGGPATGAQFSTPTGLGVDGDVTWILDSGNRRVRKIDAAGQITTVVGTAEGLNHLVAGVPVAPEAYSAVRALDLELGPDKRPVWTTVAKHQVHRLRADGQVELLAGVGGSKGAFGGDAGNPLQAGLDTPLGLAYGPDGSLYIADAGNMRIRRISPDGSRIETFTGKDRFETMVAISGDTGAPTTRDAALVVLPSAVCVDALGNVYVGEMGTVALPLLTTVTAGLAGLDIESLPMFTARIRKFAVDGSVTTLVGMGGKFFSDPLVGDALIMPTGLAIDPQGRLVITDGGANLIRFLPAGSY